MIQPDPNIQPCPRCRRMVAVFHPACPGCGQPLGRRTPPAALPPGWIAAPLPDGTVRLTRGRGLQLRETGAAALVVAVFVLGLAGKLTGAHRGHGLSGPDALVLNAIWAVIALAGGVLLVGALLWALCREEEW